MKWDFQKRKISKEVVENKLTELKSLQLLLAPLMAAIKSLKKEIDSWLEKEDVKWRHRAKNNCYKGRDKNIKFFHA